MSQTVRGGVIICIFSQTFLKWRWESKNRFTSRIFRLMKRSANSTSTLISGAAVSFPVQSAIRNIVPSTILWKRCGVIWIFFNTSATVFRNPKIRCDKCGVRQLVPYWARPQSGFTSLFEAFILTLAREMPVSQIAELVGEHDTRIWRILHFHISKAYAAKDFYKLTHIGIDET